MIYQLKHLVIQEDLANGEGWLGESLGGLLGDVHKLGEVIEDMLGDGLKINNTLGPALKEHLDLMKHLVKHFVIHYFTPYSF